MDHLKEILENPDLIKQELSRREFIDYVAYIDPKFLFGWWNTLLCHRLQQFYNDLVAGKKPVLLIQAPPQHGKSTIIILFISWVAGKNPDLRKIYASFSTRLGVRANMQLQRIYESDKYRAIFSETQINSSETIDEGRFLRNSSVLEYVNKSGGFRNTTTGGAITGESLDLGIIDDPLKGREAANSETIRNKIHDWFLDDFFSRFSENAGLLGIATRWHIDDLFGRLIDQSEELPELSNIEVFSYPAIAEEDEEHRKKGEALFPQLKSLAFLLARKAIMTLSGWAALYQQRPFLQGGGLFAIQHIQIVQFAPELVDNPIRYWDKAGTEDGGAYTAGVKMQKTKAGQFIVLDVVRKQMSPLVREKRILQTAEIDGKSCKVWVEQEPGSAGKETAESTIRNLAGFSVQADKVTGSKEDRAEPYAAQVEGGNVLLLKADWNKDFIGEHELFPSGKYKDQVDAAAGAFNKLCAAPLIGFTEKQKSDINKRARSEQKGKQW
jgi:predicted phage terminase large subunit-like protein